MSSWEMTFGSWFPCSDRLLEDPEPLSALRGMATSGVVQELEEAGAVALGAIDLRVAFPGAGGVVLAEVRGLVLRHPCPFPVFDLFPRWSRVRARLRFWS